jgi:eukaryotic-like serine/threonine-protein kinase
VSESRWELLERLFDEGLQRAPHARAAWLGELDVADDLRAELTRMLDVDARSVELTQRIDAALATAGDVPLPGMRLGAWRLVHELGSGGMGLVFLAERADDEFHQQVAIKLIRGYGGSDAARQLRHERQILAGLEHPNIARLLDGGQTVTGQPYLVMEYVRGEPITAAANARALSLVRRMELVRDIAEAVHFAHQRLIIHRDIKPANVLLRDDGRAMLLDFGIAKLLDVDGSSSGATQPWFTPAYASPEQRRGESVSTATDVYALGLLLFELITGHAPVPDAEGALQAPSLVADASLRAALRGDLDAIVLRATAPEAARRYASAEALAQDIQRWLAGRPILAAPDRFSYRAGKFVRRHPFGVAASLAFVASLALFGWRLADERDRALRAESRAETDAENARSVTRFLVELFRDADPERSRGEPITPQGLIDRGRARLDADQAIATPQRVVLLGALGELYVNMGQPEKATAVVQQALDAPVVLPPAERADLLRSLALSFELRQRFVDTERAYGEAVELLRTANAPLPLSDALAGLGLAYTRSDRNAEAEAAIREAISLRREHDGPDAVDTLRYQVYLGEALYNAGRNDEARLIMDQSIARLRATQPPDSLELIASLGFYGVLLRDLGESAAAEAVFLEILTHRQALLEGDSQKIAIVHNNLGRVYYDQGRTRDAIVQYQAAYDLGARDGADEDPSRAIDNLNLGSMYEEIGDYAAGSVLMRRGLAILEKDPQDVGFLLTMARQNLGRLLMLAGQAEESRVLLEQTIDTREDRDWAMERGRQRIHLADWHRRFGDASEARRWLAQAEANVADIGGADSPRVSAIERVRGLLAAAAGDHAAARKDLASARERLRAARGDAYVGVGELDMELAAISASLGERDRAQRELASARRILDPVLSERAPQRARLAGIEKS